MGELEIEKKNRALYPQYPYENTRINYGQTSSALILLSLLQLHSFHFQSICHSVPIQHFINHG